MENNNLHILVVDDDDRIRSLLKDYLSANSYFVSTAENSEEAKTKIKYFKFDIIKFRNKSAHVFFIVDITIEKGNSFRFKFKTKVFVDAINSCIWKII